MCNLLDYILIYEHMYIYFMNINLFVTSLECIVFNIIFV